MDSFAAVRKLARDKYAETTCRISGTVTAIALLAEARISAKAKVQVLPPEHPLLGGGDGALHRTGETPAIYLSDALDPAMAAYVEAHEFGHLWIETPAEPAIVLQNFDPSAPEENTPLGLRRVEAYSPDELRERFANVFAREFLLPCPEAKRLFMRGHSARQIATDLGIPPGIVHQQLAAALLLPEPTVEDAITPRERPGLDPSQKAAAEYEGTPLLVEAGPGTGKTRTLIARLEYLLAKNIPAPCILVLTFSNKAAREIKERVAASAPDAAPEIWAGTFHAFGLEILRKFGHLVGITEPVKPLDQADQLALLEAELPRLGLDHYLRLHEPLLELRSIIGAISRAKDEVFSPTDYADAAARMLEAADSDKEKILKADKAAEVGRVYAYYEATLRAQGLVDFADLINRSIEIMRANPDVRDELRSQYTHILVDEYQDVNRASALLLKELGGDGSRLWVVGDARQSIYRFRGAAPSNTTNFEGDYSSGRRLALAVNYRSKQQIVDVFSAFAGKMSVGGGHSLVLQAYRGSGTSPLAFNVASNRGSEITGLAASIRQRQAAGSSYRNQAVLCRSHSHLQKIAAGLEAEDIPVLYLGDLFERPEVRDLLALLSFVAERHRGGLMRLATLVRWKMPLADVQAFLAFSARIEKTPFAALSDLAGLEGLSAEGRNALLKLHDDLANVSFNTGPGQLLCEVLFEKGLIRDYLSGDTAQDQQRRLAIHQFFQFAMEYNRPGDGDPKRRLLKWVRRLEVFGDERSLREPPAAVDGINAVRLMTVHASKGLEFDTVHLPALGKGIFPLKRPGHTCPPPDGMLSGSAESDHDEEEECLFFVALSRAKDHLSLSRADRYSEKQSSNPSTALQQIAEHLPRAPDCDPTWTSALQAPIVDAKRPRLARTARDHDGRDIELYMSCPRRYLYQTILGLSASREDNGYLKFHLVLYRVLRWMADEAGPLSTEAIVAKTEEFWSETGPTGDALESLYRASAEQILERANARPRTGIRYGETLNVTFDGHTINLMIDEIETHANSFVIRRVRTGKAPKGQDHRALHALMAQAGQQAFGSKGTFEIRYLSSDDIVPISFDRVITDRLKATRAALAGLTAGDYPSIVSDDCPRCPHYFICEAVPE